MRSEDLLNPIRRRPFEPFRVLLNEGGSYEVRRPELAMVGRSSVAIGLARPDEPEPVYDRMVTVSLLHIMQVEPIVSAASP